MSQQYDTTKPLESRKGLYAYASSPSLQDVLVEKLDACPGMRVLDAGCGYGDRLAKLCAHVEGLEAVGFDASAGMIAAAHERYPSLNVQVAAIETFEPDQPFDRIFSIHVLHLIKDPLAAVTRLLSWLKPGGRLLLVLHSETDQPRKQAWDQQLVQAGSIHEANGRTVLFEHDAGISETFHAERSLHVQTITLDTPEPYLQALESHRARWTPMVSDDAWAAYIASARTEMEHDIQTTGHFTETTTYSLLVINKPL